MPIILLMLHVTISILLSEYGTCINNF